MGTTPCIESVSMMVKRLRPKLFVSAKPTSLVPNITVAKRGCTASTSCCSGVGVPVMAENALQPMVAERLVRSNGVVPPTMPAWK